VWSSRKGCELPLLMIVTNNRWGISTPYDGQHGETQVAERGKAFGIRTAVIDGNDPEISYAALAEAIGYVRSERKPFLLEAMVSRLRGHSSASGANPIKNEPDCVEQYEKTLESRGLMTRAQIDQLRTRYTDELAEAARTVRGEPQPEPDAIYDYVFADKNLVAGEH
jgi:2-oxoisovalerate dehydrogenase E1 component alpha subunit